MSNKTSRSEMRNFVMKFIESIFKSHLVYNSLYKEIQNLNDEADFFIYDITYEEKILKIHNFEKEKNKLKEKIEESYQGLLLEYSCCYESYESYERFLIEDKNSLLDILNDLSESRYNAFYSSDEKCYELKEKIQKWKKEKAKEVEHGNKEN